MKELGVKVENIDAYYHALNPTLANCLLHLLTFFRPSEKLFERMLGHVRPFADSPPRHRLLMLVLRFVYLLRKGYDHFRFMDFSIIPGRSGYVLYRLGVIDLWRRLFTARAPRPASLDRPAPVLLRLAATELGTGHTS
jgi:hypothetical protein